MAGDVALTTRSTINLLINGAGSVQGLAYRLAAVFPTNPPAVKHRDSYDSERQGEAAIPSRLDKVYVTIQLLTKTKVGTFRGDRHPTEPTHSWTRRINLQFDIWGRTPVEVSNTSDVLEAEFVRMHHALWAYGRIALQVEEFETVPLEEDTGIFRALARGYCQTAALAAI